MLALCFVDFHVVIFVVLLQIEACQTHATALLEDQPDNEDAAIMLAELMAHQVGCQC
jgi:hypothetical protein